MVEITIEKSAIKLPIIRTSFWNKFVKTDETLESYLCTAIHAAKQAGQILIDLMGTAAVKEKAPRDLVTEADVAAQNEIERILLEKFPDHQFVGEEGKPIDPDGFKGLTWVVDPLDGTTNFVHQLRSFSVSIALLQDDQPIVGVVYDPLCDECFSAVKGGGAHLNESEISVSSCRLMREAMLVTGFSPSVTKDSIEAKRFLEVLGKAQTIRRLGSAALNLCFIACGRVDAYWASSLNAWDIAAGMLIMSEAGGTVLGIDGVFDLFKPKFIAAASSELQDELALVIDIAD
jgi:myo-inositol-1(or 4)-monophosphatase